MRDLLTLDMVETRRSSSAYKRFCSSSSSPEPSFSSSGPSKGSKVKIGAALLLLLDLFDSSVSSVVSPCTAVLAKAQVYFCLTT